MTQHTYIITFDPFLTVKGSDAKFRTSLASGINPAEPMIIGGLKGNELTFEEYFINNSVKFLSAVRPR